MICKQCKKVFFGEPQQKYCSEECVLKHAKITRNAKAEHDKKQLKLKDSFVGHKDNDIGELVL